LICKAGTVFDGNGVDAVDVQYGKLVDSNFGNGTSLSNEVAQLNEKSRVDLGKWFVLEMLIVPSLRKLNISGAPVIDE
jgi:hypothetical protein